MPRTPSIQPPPRALPGGIERVYLMPTLWSHMTVQADMKESVDQPNLLGGQRYGSTLVLYEVLVLGQRLEGHPREVARVRSLPEALIWWSGYRNARGLLPALDQWCWWVHSQGADLTPSARLSAELMGRTVFTDTPHISHKFMPVLRTSLRDEGLSCRVYAEWDGHGAPRELALEVEPF